MNMLGIMVILVDQTKEFNGIKKKGKGRRKKGREKERQEIAITTLTRNT
jgi:hypothetical protein